VNTLSRVLDELAADAPLERASWTDVQQRARQHRRLARQRIARPRVPRRYLIAAVGAVVLTVAGTTAAVRLDFLDQQERFHASNPDHARRVGPLVEITSGETWSLIAWRSREMGLCLDFAVPGNSPFGCGFPVRGAKPASHTSGGGPPIHAVAGQVSGGGLVGGDGKGTIFGVAASDVARVQIELSDGRVVEARLYDAPPELDTSVRFFIVRLALPSQPLHGVERVRAFLAYNARGELIERFAD
jgi:hypothetical protein